MKYKGEKMKILELIKKLENIQIDHGNLDVKFDAMANFCDIEEVYIDHKYENSNTVIIGG